MEENKFFRFVWRFNAIVIMASGVLTLAGLIFVVGGKISRSIDRQSKSVINVDRDAEIAEESKIDEYRQVAGTPYLMFPLKLKQSYRRSSYSSKSASSSRNFLFVNSQTNEKQWLLPNNKSLIISDFSIANKEGQNSSSQAILYTLVDRDSNQDRILTASDLQTLSISLPNGKKYQEIVKGIDRFLGYKLINDSQIVVIYKQKETIYSQAVYLENSNFSILTKPAVIYKP